MAFSIYIKSPVLTIALMGTCLALGYKVGREVERVNKVGEKTNESKDI